MEASKYCETNMDQLWTKNSIIFDFSLKIPIYDIKHVHQYVPHILTHYASHTVLRYASLIYNTYLHIDFR